MFKLLVCLLLVPSICFGWGAGIYVGGVDEEVTAGYIGNETGDAAGTNDGVNEVAYATFTTTTEGTVTYIHAYLGSVASSSHFNAGIYSAAGDLLADGALTDGVSADPGYIHIELDSAVTLSASTDYTLLIGTNDDAYWRLRGTTGGSGKYNITVTVTDSLPASLPTGGGTINYILAIWADNDATGGL